MSILMPDLTVEVYNADYRVLSQIRWQEAIRLILRGAVYVIDLQSPRGAHTQSVTGYRASAVSGAARIRAHPPQGGQ
jgi:hypothetical protein